MMKTFCLIPIFLFLVGSSISSQLAFADEKLPVNWQGLPEPYATPSANKPPMLIEKPDDAELILPPGFSITPFATGLVSPRFMISDANGVVIVSDTFAGKVYAVTENSKKQLISGLDVPYGLAFHEGWLYVAETTQVLRYRYDPEALSVAKGELVVNLSDAAGGHKTRTITFDSPHEWLYLSVGSKSNVNAGEPPRRAAISRFKPDGSGEELFVSGIRNAVGMRFYPETDQLWVTSHERDGLGDDLVPDYFSSVDKADFFGWPYAYIGPHEDPRRAGEAPELVKTTRYPDVLLGSHVGALDVLFYTGEQFPTKYHGGAFIALHGSWNRSKRVGYKVVFVPFENAQAISGPEDFLTGWRISPERPEVWGRPVGLLQMADGSLLLSDDASGKIWRIRYSSP